VGRARDLTVIWVLEKIADAYFTRRVITMSGESFDAQEERLYEVLNLPAISRCCIDQTGLGRQFAERASKRFSEYRIEGISFTGPVKEELAYPVRSAFESKRLRIPKAIEIRKDLGAVRKEMTLAGNIRFVAERTEAGHADRFWALALALHAGKTTQQPFSTESVRIQPSMFPAMPRFTPRRMRGWHSN
jgi:phage FluMu gp28-like protein